MGSVNKVTLLGRVGKDPESRSANGTPVTAFSMATTETWKDKTTGEKKEATEWHNVVLWRGLAEVAAKYVHKGDLIYIEGKLTTRMWEKDGVKRYSTEVVANELLMLGNKQNSQGQTQPQVNGSAGYSSAADNSTDDLPF